jgi:tungstate transport system ATP-binding protein
MTNLIEIENLVVKRDSLTVLDIAGIAVREGEVLAVIGPNGAGKSTLMLVLAQLLKPAQGKISFHGQLLESMNALEYRRKIGLVLQEPLLMDTSVFKNVATGLRFRGLAKDEIDRRVYTWLERWRGAADQPGACHGIAA